MRVLIADDNADIRLLTRALFNADGRVTVVHEACDGVEAVVGFRETDPDVCVLDQQMPGQSGLDAARQILAEAPWARLLLYTAFLSDDIVAEASALGIRCIRKDQFEDLVDVVIDLTD